MANQKIASLDEACGLIDNLLAGDGFHMLKVRTVRPITDRARLVRHAWDEACKKRGSVRCLYLQSTEFETRLTADVMGDQNPDKQCLVDKLPQEGEQSILSFGVFATAPGVDNLGDVVVVIDQEMSTSDDGALVVAMLSRYAKQAAGAVYIRILVLAALDRDLSSLTRHAASHVEAVLEKPKFETAALSNTDVDSAIRAVIECLEAGKMVISFLEHEEGEEIFLTVAQHMELNGRNRVPISKLQCYTKFEEVSNFFDHHIPQIVIMPPMIFSFPLPFSNVGLVLSSANAGLTATVDRSNSLIIKEERPYSRHEMGVHHAYVYGPSAVAPEAKLVCTYGRPEVLAAPMIPPLRYLNGEIREFVFKLIYAFPHSSLEEIDLGEKVDAHDVVLLNEMARRLVLMGLLECDTD